MLAVHMIHLNGSDVTVDFNSFNSWRIINDFNRISKYFSHECENVKLDAYRCAKGTDNASAPRGVSRDTSRGAEQSEVPSSHIRQIPTL